MIVCPECRAAFSLRASRCEACGFVLREVDGIAMWAPDLSKRPEAGFEPDNFPELAKMEQGHFWFESRNALILAMLRKHFPSFGSLLEVGCGTGYVLSAIASAFPGARLVGSEMFSEAIPIAKARVPKANFVQMDARKIPYVEEFEVACAFDVLEHIEDDQKVLDMLHRSIVPGGGLLLSVPQHPWLWSSVDDAACHVRRYKADELRVKVRRAGFEIVRSFSFMFLLLAPMLLSRMRATGSKPFDPMEEFRISSALNGALFSILWLERLMILSGIPTPVGGSRILVARKRA